jgi:hypothetical protein
MLKFVAGESHDAILNNKESNDGIGDDADSTVTTKQCVA